MKTIRRGLFETNSSSVHSLTIMTQEEYDKWNDDTYLCDDKVLTFEEAKNEAMDSAWFRKNKAEQAERWTKEEWDEYFAENGYETPEKYDSHHEDFELFEKRFKTPSGDEMVAFGYSGYDG